MDFVTCISLYLMLGSLTLPNIKIPISKTFEIRDISITVSNIVCTRIYFGGASFNYNNSEISLVAGLSGRNKNNMDYNSDSKLGEDDDTKIECSVNLKLKTPMIDESNVVYVTLIVPNGGQLVFDLDYFNNSCLIKKSSLRTCTIAPQIAKLDASGASVFFREMLLVAKNEGNLMISKKVHEFAELINKIISEGMVIPPSPIPPFLPGATPVEQWPLTNRLETLINSLPVMLDGAVKLSAEFPTHNAIRINTTLYKDVSFDYSYLTDFKLRISVPSLFGITGTIAFPYLSCSRTLGLLCGLKHAYIENIRTVGNGIGIGEKFIDDLLGPGISNLANEIIHFINKTKTIDDFLTTLTQFDDNKDSVVVPVKIEKRSKVRIIS